MMDAAVSSELVEEICLLVVFDNLKKHINNACDIPNKTLDTLISVLLSNGGKVSQAKRDYVSKFIDEAMLHTTENMATELIQRVKSDFSVDIQEVMNRPR